MATYDFDLFVIGGGSGGVRAARIAGNHGARVAIAEADRYGGTCVIRGCIPKKFFAYASAFSDLFEDAAAYGWTVEGARFDWQKLVAHKDERIARLESIYARLLEGAGCEVLHGRARLADAHTVEIGEKRVTAKHILVATGGRPDLPEAPGIEHAIVSDDAFDLDPLPERIAVVGGGYIAVEFAGIFHGLGREVTLIHRGARVLRGFDEDVREALTQHLAHTGMRLRLENTVSGIEKLDSGALRLSLSDDEPVEADTLLCATGRVPNTRGLGLEEVGVKLASSGAVVVDTYSRTSVPHIYAVGDCTDRVNLTPVAIREGHAFADTVFGGADRPVEHQVIPSAVFSHPPVGVVGLSEDEARQRGHELDIYRSSFRPLFHSMTGRQVKTMMKLVVDAKTQRVLGAHMVGDDAPEIIQGVAVAVKMGATKADFDATIAVHPTSAEEFVLMREKVARP
jgi:glutathione reductase (NADPH)